MDEYLDSYVEKLGLKGVQEQDISFYLGLNADGLRKMSPEDCFEGAYLLKKEALYIQYVANKLTAQIAWAKNRISSIIAGELHSYSSRGVSFETQRILAIKNNHVASELQNTVVKKAELTLERIQYISKQVSEIAEVLMKYAYQKTGEIKYEQKTSKAD